MTNTHSNDQTANPFTLPFTSMRSLRDSVLETWAKLAIDAVNTDLFAQMLGMYLNTSLTSAAPVQRAVDQYMQALLPRLSIPSRSEVTTIAQRLTNIELRLDDLDARLDDLLQASQPQSATAASGAIDERLQAIESRLDTLLAAAKQSAPVPEKPARPRRAPTKKSEARE
jgi:ABC-type phosphate transport system auxiliary subunit